jgi:hypothetical protein
MKETRKKSFFVMVSLIVLVALVLGSWGTAQAFVIPTFSITSVVTDNTVTIQTANFPANDTFVVRMNVIGTRGVGGYQVATTNSGAGGALTLTYSIPAELRGLRQIAIRLESPTTGYFAYNWFYNNTTGGTIPDTGVPTLPPGVFPTFSITGVVRDTSVTVRTANLPANDTFIVRMNVIGTRGVGGYQVDTVNTGTGGAQTLTFNIPAQLHGLRQIAIRMESPTSGYFAFNWFYNNTTGETIPDTGVPTLPPGVIPTFTITSVVRDTSVTIQTANFTANDTFTVTMGSMGTRGIGGIVVEPAFASGAGGVLTATFNVPAQLHGSNQIAIRLQSPVSGYYSYNWFYNNTFP